MTSRHRIRLAADVGGTFTDVVLETADGLVTSKVSTETFDPEQGILRGVEIVLETAAIKPAEIDSFIHGTTLATNALIERKGARTALITTEGFRDSIEIGYENRYDQYDLAIEPKQALVPRSLRFTVRERVDVNGCVLRELDPATVEAIIPELRREAIEAIAIGFIHSYANPAHEQQVAAMLRDAGIDAEISLSSEVCPEVREYERFMTTVCNAYVQPLMAGYLRALQSALSQRGFACPLLLMTSGGGMTSLDAAIRFPIRLVESGPSGGAVLASKIARQIGESKVLSYDMGGTTAKICLIDDYQPQTARNFEIARSARFFKGSGMPVRIPVVEMIEIGAGGGSIAHIDSLGRLAIGPKSAGATPGPACYQKGGQKPTVTDADLLLGKIDPDQFAEGRMPLDVALAQTAIDQHLGAAMQLDSLTAASGIAEMVEENMANAARIHSVEHGANLADYTMIAFGGAGPLHAIRLAQKLNIQRIIIPRNSSVGSAVGFLAAPIAYELVHSHYMTTQGFDAAVVNRLLDGLQLEATDVVQTGAGDQALKVVRSAYMRYAGQGHEIEVMLPERTLTDSDSDTIQQRYEAHYHRLFGRVIPARDIEILSWSVVVSTIKESQIVENSSLAWHDAIAQQHRPCFCPDRKQLIDYAVYARNDLQPGDRLSGPALIIEAQTTSWVCSAYNAHIDANYNLIIERSLINA